MIFSLTEVFITYKTDVWHTEDSKIMLGIGSNLETAIGFAKECAKREKEKFSKTDLRHLTDMKQTQDYKGDGEFVIQVEKLNKYLL